MMVTFHLWKERLIFPLEEVPALEEVLASTLELRSVNFFLHFLCLGTMGLQSPFVFYALVDIVTRFFDTDLCLLIRLSVIEVKRKKVVTKTSLRYSCKNQKLLNYHHFSKKR